MTRHTVYTLCLDCGKWGCNLPWLSDCGNCGSRDTIKYMSKDDIYRLMTLAYGVGKRSHGDQEYNEKLIRLVHHLEEEGEL